MQQHQLSCLPVVALEAQLEPCHREQMVNGCVTRSIDFLTQTRGPFCAAAETHSQMWSLAECIDFWVMFCTGRKA